MTRIKTLEPVNDKAVKVKLTRTDDEKKDLDELSAQISALNNKDVVYLVEMNCSDMRKDNVQAIEESIISRFKEHGLAAIFLPYTPQHEITIYELEKRLTELSGVDVEKVGYSEQKDYYVKRPEAEKAVTVDPCINCTRAGKGIGLECASCIHSKIILC